MSHSYLHGRMSHNISTEYKSTGGWRTSPLSLQRQLAAAQHHPQQIQTRETASPAVPSLGLSLGVSPSMDHRHDMRQLISDIFPSESSRMTSCRHSKPSLCSRIRYTKEKDTQARLASTTKVLIGTLSAWTMLDIDVTKRSGHSIECILELELVTQHTILDVIFQSSILARWEAAHRCAARNFAQPRWQLLVLPDPPDAIDHAMMQVEGRVSRRDIEVLLIYRQLLDYSDIRPAKGGYMIRRTPPGSPPIV